jgi:hypothetical protein
MHPIQPSSRNIPSEHTVSGAGWSLSTVLKTAAVGLLLFTEGALGACNPNKEPSQARSPQPMYNFVAGQPPISHEDLVELANRRVADHPAWGIGHSDPSLMPYKQAARRREDGPQKPPSLPPSGFQRKPRHVDQQLNRRQIKELKSIAWLSDRGSRSDDSGIALWRTVIRSRRISQKQVDEMKNRLMRGDLFQGSTLGDLMGSLGDAQAQLTSQGSCACPQNGTIPVPGGSDTPVPYHPTPPNVALFEEHEEPVQLATFVSSLDTSHLAKPKPIVRRQ